ncbi:hypothetical protein C7E19_13865, partial [Stenotrophomonas maltophilia]
MKIELTGRTALVTASTAGIGLAIAQGLANAGARIILNGRSTDSVERRPPSACSPPFRVAD